MDERYAADDPRRYASSEERPDDIIEQVLSASNTLDMASDAANAAGWAFRHPSFQARLGNLAIDLDRLWRDLDAHWSKA